MLPLFFERITQILNQDAIYQRLQAEFRRNKFPVHFWGPPLGFFMSSILALLFQEREGPLLLVTPTQKKAKSLRDELAALFANPDSVLLFPEWEWALFRGISPPQRLLGNRVRVLADLLREGGSPPIVVASLPAFLSKLPPPERLKELLFRLKIGDDIDVVKLVEVLDRAGYRRVPRVCVPGEYAVKGEVVEFFHSGTEYAWRVVFDFEVIEFIRKFNPVSQHSVSEEKECWIYPMKESYWDEATVARLASWFACREEEDLCESPVESLEQGIKVRGEERFAPLGYQRSCSLLDYAADQHVLLFLESEALTARESHFATEFDKFTGQMREQKIDNPPFSALFHSLAALGQRCLRCAQHRTFTGKKEQEVTLPKSLPGSRYGGNLIRLKEELTAKIKEGYEIFVCCESESQQGRIQLLLKDFPITYVTTQIGEGFTLPAYKILVIQESEIFGKEAVESLASRAYSTTEIQSFLDISPGDFVVHIQHGIGKFLGIERMSAGGSERDYISLEYLKKEKIFLPIEQLNLLQLYVGGGEGAPSLDAIGGTSWQKRKSRVKRAVDDLADKLTELYARREEAVGFAFPGDEEVQTSFEAAFPHRETPDQARAIEEVKGDMESARPMDRLICGDVGFGKTEIALRAAFKAILGGRQVVFLCPTTILAEQHYELALERFERFPVVIKMLSRFVKQGERRQVLEDLEKGEVDLVIGTQRLLSKDVKFRRLGLLIIDEEQRFGVKAKEKLKELKISMDCLAMSATPIPRTLQMSLAKIRDMSVLLTPPASRQPVETFVMEFDPEIIRRAILQEIERGGQIFYLHNRIESLDGVRRFLQELLPEVSIDVVHGRMDSGKIEEVMHRFIYGGSHLLLTTTIIENGINISNVNTIIIDRADMYGVSQLYQLRGRVGRSSTLAYAYLFYPHRQALSEMAMKRLQTISDFTELGSGFRVAVRDMEVRGAGELLGRRQSGDVYAVGMEMYLKLLKEAIGKRGEVLEQEPPELKIELQYTAYIPDDYISNPAEKMEFYKRIASVSEETDLLSIYGDFEDRFGPIPERVESLLLLAEVRVLCRRLWVTHLGERSGKVLVTFAGEVPFSFDRLIERVQEGPRHFGFDPTVSHGLILDTTGVNPGEKFNFVRQRLSTLLSWVAPSSAS